ncbi:hypothetical protein [Mycobacteroides salmoniphilum]|uniref:Uncharacterized protein n=1 Tax=Mycobacteroides salmoniphilum TaxID=404941 RepID=A0A4V3I1H4_9MYCO|nr:hypothetical protein [Mycobacteroides salmoniphilum]TEA09184.1 hypothetical protein CCUG60884_00174 [Mycobacteroides salmoniphilum]
MSNETFAWFTVGRYTVNPRFLLSEAIAELEKFGDVINVYDEYGHFNTIELACDETFRSSAARDELEANARWALPVTWRCGYPDVVNATREADWLVINLEAESSAADVS